MLQSFSRLSIYTSYLSTVSKNFWAPGIVYGVRLVHRLTHRPLRDRHPGPRLSHSLPWSPTPNLHIIPPSQLPTDHFAPILTSIGPVDQKFHVWKSCVTSSWNVVAAARTSSENSVLAADTWQTCQYNVVQCLRRLLVAMYLADHLMY